ncbi:hypothetical protein RFI_08582 [Reticulomyxa filosa]|uniref:Uncharacterized protein n=1 Tax=Reticulomyxa filosa TaxID=46433 RepID=X6NTB1_RETFI|nr:hypothetical protein RFI_08582 [Reticulomyxa filosa]|eukprot:ETO28547.1 hypothetical protein RFI_08582 [Reticulomyxa filosa]
MACDTHWKWSKFLFVLGIVELAIGIIALCGLNVNVLATTEGVADVKLRKPVGVYAKGVSIGQYYTDVTMTASAYDFDSRMSSELLGNYTNTTHYTYESAYKDACKDSDSNTNKSSSNTTSNNCNLRYAIWKWSDTFLTMGFTASVIVLCIGVYFFFFFFLFLLFNKHFFFQKKKKKKKGVK